MLRLVELSEDIRRNRHDRIREIQWERDSLNRRERRPWDDERVFEREIVVSEGRSGRGGGRYR